MERRTFVRGAFGLAVLAAGGGLVGSLALRGEPQDDVFVTAGAASPEMANGPVMAAGIELVPDGEGLVTGRYDDKQLFSVDETGAELMRLADGSLTLDELAEATGTALNPADVASFFVELGQAGYLQNEVFVNFYQVGA